MSQSRQLAAIMFTDIVGYTALMGRDSNKALELVRISKEIQKPLVEKHQQQSIKEENKELVRRWIMTTDAQELDSYDKFLSSDVVSHLPGSILNRIEIEQFERSFADAFPDASRTIEDLIAEDDKVVMRERSLEHI